MTKTTIIGTLVLMSMLARFGRPAEGQSAGSQPATGASAGLGAAELDQAVGELADARWDVRRAAGFKLIDAGETALPALRRAYVTGRSHEVRLRIRELAEAIYSDVRIPSKGGFLGIRQRPRVRQLDPRVPSGTTWVEVLQVFRDTAADRASLRPGDLVIGCDGQTLPEDPTGQAFGQMVSRHRPGEEIPLEIIRGTADPITLKVRLGRRPMAVLAEADPEAYAPIRTAFEDWWQERFASGTSRPAATRPAGGGPAKGGSRRR